MEINSSSHLNFSLDKYTTKERITIRIDPDVLTWFRQMSPNSRGYQSRINSALREFMNNGLQTVEEVMRKVIREELLEKDY